MKKLLVFFLIALATCEVVEESSDDNVVLEKSGFSIPKVSIPKTPKITVPKTPKITVPKSTKIKPPKTTPLKTTPLKTTPLKTTPLKTTPLKTTPLKTTPLKTTPLKTTPLKTTPLKTTPLKTTPLKTTPLTSTKIDPSKLNVRKNLKEANKISVKGVNGLFGLGKVGEFFRKLGDVVKKGIAWLKQNKLWDPIVEQLKNLGQKYGNELCEKVLSPEICGPAIDFALDHLLPSEQN